MWNRAILLLFFWLFTNPISAQQKHINGVVLDKSSKVQLKAITVMLKSEEGHVIAFKTTDANGSFVLTTDKDIKGAILEINHLGYKKMVFPVETRLVDLRIEMEQQAILLDSIVIKSRPAIQRQGDTLSYNVSAFAKEEDRSIAEVIRRMPGMEVSENGRIKFQGKSISNFYIDGDDLLDDRYTIGSKTISHKMVQDVQVLNNHEHMKVLKNKRYSDDVALNLVLKDEAKLALTGQVKLGAGLPHQYDVEVNSILFNKKHKMINALQGNNVGHDLSADFFGFNSQSILAKMGASPVDNMLSLGTVSAPMLPKQLYYRNNSGALSANYLINKKNNWQIKTNLQAVFDKNERDFATTTTYNDGKNSISFDEQQAADAIKWLSAWYINLERNADKQYFKNTLSLEYENEQARADIQGNDRVIGVNRRHSVRGFSNSIDYVPALANGHIIQAKWYVNYGNKPQSLTLQPGLFEHLLNDNVNYNESLQQVEVPSFFTRGQVGYRLPNGRIGQYYAVETMLESQHLKSAIDLRKGDIWQSPAVDSTVNDMRWLRYRVHINAEYEWRKNRFSSRLVLPLALQNTDYKDQRYELHEKSNKLLFNPSFNAKYRVGMEDEWTFSYQRNTSFGNIADLYRGLLIKNYRTIARNSGTLNENVNNNFDVNYKFGRSLQLLFLNFGIRYVQSTSSNIVSNTVSDTTTETELLKQDNRVNTYAASVGFDKYLFALASSIKLNASWSLVDYNQLFNHELLPFKNITYGLSPSMDIKIVNNLNLNYTSNLSWTSARQSGGTAGLDRNTFNTVQHLSFPVYVFKVLHVRMAARHIFSHQPGLKDINYLFFDSFVRYRHKKWNTDFELNLTNMANIKTFETYTISANMQAQNRYELRGRMAVFKAVFNFK
ncbi:carboxypeptidase-like regulatory domain-containing protein [Sphingobacterium sp. Mn56C]|uniref:carboxypeptidase-like regulatory domain-containing protein n=1 Tax=Sphingobacterium sp. Mn56C TaxID=3395261 RepID=UPI003BEDF60A